MVRVSSLAKTQTMVRVNCQNGDGGGSWVGNTKLVNPPACLYNAPSLCTVDDELLAYCVERPWRDRRRRGSQLERLREIRPALMLKAWPATA